MTAVLEVASWLNFAKMLYLRSDVESDAALVRLEAYLSSSGRSFLDGDYSEADREIFSKVGGEFPDVARWLCTVLGKMGKADATSSLVTFSPTLFPIPSPVGLPSSASKTAAAPAATPVVEADKKKAVPTPAPPSTLPTPVPPPAAAADSELDPSKLDLRVGTRTTITHTITQ